MRVIQPGAEVATDVIIGPIDRSHPRRCKDQDGTPDASATMKTLASNVVGKK
jgi:hypothetical protein